MNHNVCLSVGVSKKNFKILGKCRIFLLSLTNPSPPLTTFFCDFPNSELQLTCSHIRMDCLSRQRAAVYPSWLDMRWLVAILILINLIKTGSAVPQVHSTIFYFPIYYRGFHEKGTPSYLGAQG